MDSEKVNAQACISRSFWRYVSQVYRASFSIWIWGKLIVEAVCLEVASPLGSWNLVLVNCFSDSKNNWALSREFGSKAFHVSLMLHKEIWFSARKNTPQETEMNDLDHWAELLFVSESWWGQRPFCPGLRYCSGFKLGMHSAPAPWLFGIRTDMNTNNQE